jgi:hypothetical protein
MSGSFGAGVPQYYMPPLPPAPTLAPLATNKNCSTDNAEIDIGETQEVPKEVDTIPVAEDPNMIDLDA